MSQDLFDGIIDYRLRRIVFVIEATIILLFIGCTVCRCEETIDTSLIIFHFHGPDTTSYIGSHISSLGDINNDGFDDIALSCRFPSGTYIFYGGDPVDTNPDIFIDSCYDLQSIEDITGDGIRDGLGQRVGASGNTIRLCFYRGYEDSLASVPFDSLTPDTAVNSFGVYSHVGYIDGDSYPDLITLEIRAYEDVVKYYSGCPILDRQVDWQYITPLYHFHVSGLSLIDFDGDNNLDVCAGYVTGIGDTGYIHVYTGPDFGNGPDIIIEAPLDQYRIMPYLFSSYSSNIGDFNGDGWNDLGNIYVSDTGGYFPLIYLCGPGADTQPDIKLDNQGSYISGVGDINNDGFGDLAIGGLNSWEGMVFLYLCGPQADSIFDDIITANDLPPLFLDDIGFRISSAGDFNGDGISDFIFSCRNFYPISTSPGDVFVVAGSENIVADVGNIPQQIIPKEVELRQNYPNPFNPSTTIEFFLPRSEYIYLEIYNTTGQKVTTLIDRKLPAGLNQVTWTAIDEAGQPLASGVYYYRLTADGREYSRSMVLVK